MDILMQFAYDMAKRRLRATSIVGEPFKPHAYVPIDINKDKVLATLKELGMEEIPDEAVTDIHGVVIVGMDPTHMDMSLNMIGSLLSNAGVTKVAVACDMEVEKMEVLCVADINLKAPDTQIMLPYARGEEDVDFGEPSVDAKVDETLRDKIVEGFLQAEAKKYMDKEPEGNIDAYVDGLPTEFPNVEGALNEGGKQ